MALVPKDLLEQIADLERLFTVPKEKLITITDRFVDELEKGLSKEGGSIVCLLSRNVDVAYASGLGDGFPRRYRIGCVPCSRHGRNESTGLRSRFIERGTQVRHDSV
jgi:hypothetical protein